MENEIHNFFSCNLEDEIIGSMLPFRYKRLPQYAIILLQISNMQVAFIMFCTSAILRCKHKLMRQTFRISSRLQNAFLCNVENDTGGCDRPLAVKNLRR